VTEIRERLLAADKASIEEAHRPNEPIDPYPKLIGRTSSHPLDCAAQVLWANLGSSKKQYIVQDVSNVSEGKANDTMSGATKGSKKRRWRPVRLC